MQEKATEDLLREVYMDHAGNPLMQELAKRLEEATDELETLKGEEDEH
jgi:hypothetical protein